MALNDDAVGCGTAYTLEELLMAAIGTDAEGKPTLRVIDRDDVGTNFFSCAKGLSKEDVLKQLFTLDSNGLVAIRISIP